MECAKCEYLHTSLKEFDERTKDYLLYVLAIINGEKGKTAEFWMKYVQLIHVYHEYSRSLREEDLHGYISCLPKFINMVFALNLPNYACWTVKYHDILLTLEETHPETFREYQNGMFSINRTTKPFSRNPIDLALEQRVNDDAASQRTGIAFITNSILARQRWAESHFLRTTIISYLNEDLNLTEKEDITESLKASNIKIIWQ